VFTVATFDLSAGFDVFECSSDNSKIVGSEGNDTEDDTSGRISEG
jgi:hypothetical protein